MFDELCIITILVLLTFAKEIPIDILLNYRYIESFGLIKKARKT